jgi:hypothetical protein
VSETGFIFDGRAERHKIIREYVDAEANRSPVKVGQELEGALKFRAIAAT